MKRYVDITALLEPVYRYGRVMREDFTHRQMMMMLLHFGEEFGVGGCVRTCVALVTDLRLALNI